MNRFLLFSVSFVLFSCVQHQNDETNDDLETESIDISVENYNDALFKTIYTTGDTLVTVFLNKEEGQIFRSYLVDTVCVKKDTLEVGFPVVNQSYVQQQRDGGLFVFTPDDSIALTILSYTESVHFSPNDFRLSDGTKINFGLDTKIVSDTKKSVETFEYRLARDVSNSNVPMTGVFNVKSGIVDITGINYPERYRTNYYGFLHDIQEVHTNDLVIYNPIALPEVWIYNRETKSTEVKTVRSKYQINDVESISTIDKSKSEIKTILENHQAANGNYSRLVYNENLNCYYRFYQHPQALKTNDGYFTTYQNRRVSCMQLNENFELIKEVMLPVDCFFVYLAIPTNEGFIINRGSLMEDQELRLLAVTL